MWYEKWLQYRRIDFQWIYEEGGENLNDSYGRPGTFGLIPEFLVDRDYKLYLHRFRIQCSGLDAHPALNGIIVAPGGAIEPSLNGDKLPVWIDEATSRPEYDAVLGPFVENVNNEAVITTKALEGTYSVPLKGQLALDRIRIYLIEKALVSDEAVAVVTFKLLSGGGRLQDGGGSGPPH